MKFLVAFVAVIALAVAQPTRDTVSPVLAGPAPIILEPSPATTLPGVISPIAVGPAIVDTGVSPVAVGPTLVDFPITADGQVIAEPSPALEISGSDRTPLVQIILNINQAAAEAGSPAIVAPAPVLLPAAPEIVSVVEASPEPVSVVEAAPESVVVVAPEPISVITPVIVAPEAAPGIVVGVAPEPISVITPVVVNPEPISVGTPILPAPAVVLPEILN